MKTLIIIRGAPGSGKTSLAGILSFVTVEADQFFTKPDGTYKWNPELLEESHEWCRDRTEKFMKEGIAKIAVSNTFTREQYVKPYRELAKKHGYEIQEIAILSSPYSNIHGVPAERVAKMQKLLEYDLYCRFSTT